jgi:hypothetical protein
MLPPGEFVSDAFAHLKFVGYVEAALPLFENNACQVQGTRDLRDPGTACDVVRINSKGPETDE